MIHGLFCPSAERKHLLEDYISMYRTRRRRQGQSSEARVSGMRAILTVKYYCHRGRLRGLFRRHPIYSHTQRHVGPKICASAARPIFHADFWFVPFRFSLMPARGRDKTGELKRVPSLLFLGRQELQTSDLHLVNAAANFGHAKTRTTKTRFLLHMPFWKKKIPTLFFNHLFFLHLGDGVLLRR